ncbi:MAG: hypothetical protein AB7O88_10955 [Reyranellaceae bacterium]
MRNIDGLDLGLAQDTLAREQQRADGSEAQRDARDDDDGKGQGTSASPRDPAPSSRAGASDER